MKHDSATFASWYKETYPKKFELVHIQKDPESIEIYNELQKAWWIFWLDRLIEKVENDKRIDC